MTIQTFHNDPNLQHSNNPNMPHRKPSSTVEQAKAQEAARTTVVNGASLHTDMQKYHIYTEEENAKIRKAHVTSVATPKDNSSPTAN